MLISLVNSGYGLGRSVNYIFPFYVAPFIAVAIKNLRVNPNWFYMACFVAAILTGGLAVVQRFFMSYERSTGFMNAIQFADVSVMLAIFCYFGGRMSNRLYRFSLVGLFMATVSSVLSESRGSWLVMIILFYHL